MPAVIQNVRAHLTALSNLDARSLAYSRAYRMAANGSRITIGLLATNYSGSNLGDGAIFDAILMNLSKRIPGADSRHHPVSKGHGKASWDTGLSDHGSDC